MILPIKAFSHFRNDIFFESFYYGMQILFDKTYKINFDQKCIMDKNFKNIHDLYEPRMMIILKILLGILLSMVDPLIWGKLLCVHYRTWKWETLHFCED